MKVYGICENKCLERVVSASDIIIVEGTSEYAGESEYGNYHTCEIALPEGYSAENSIILSINVLSTANNSDLYFGNEFLQGGIWGDSLNLNVSANLKTITFNLNGVTTKSGRLNVKLRAINIDGDGANVENMSNNISYKIRAAVLKKFE